jgi:hypothetical protein
MKLGRGTVAKQENKEMKEKSTGIKGENEER